MPGRREAVGARGRSLVSSHRSPRRASHFAAEVARVPRTGYYFCRMRHVTRLQGGPIPVERTGRPVARVALRLAAASSLLFTHSCKSPEEEQRSAELRASRPFIEQLERTNACPGCDIKWADFTGKNFAGADLRRAQLWMVVAPDSNFRGANLTGGSLFGQLQRADLRDMIVHDGGVSGELDGADLRGSVFSGYARLMPRSARGTRMDGLDLRTNMGMDSSNWSGASLRGANLRGLVMNGMSGSYKRIAAVPSRLEAGYGGSRWTGADLRDADLRDTSFNSCDLSNADLRGAQLQGARFSGANLQAAQLSLEALADADFGAATWIDGTKCDSFKSMGRCAPPQPRPPKRQPPAAPSHLSDSKSRSTQEAQRKSYSPSQEPNSTPTRPTADSLTSASPSGT